MRNSREATKDTFASIHERRLACLDEARPSQWKLLLVTFTESFECPQIAMD